MPNCDQMQDLRLFVRICIQSEGGDLSCTLRINCYNVTGLWVAKPNNGRIGQIPIIEDFKDSAPG